MNSESEETYEADDKLTEMDWDGIKTPNIKPGMFVSGWEEDADGIEEDKNPTETPERELLWAANENRIDIIFKILNKQPEVVNTVDRDGYTALHKAAYNDFYELAQLLLKYKADVNAITEMKWTPLHSACKWNNAKTAALLLQHNTNINARSEGDQTPLHIAATTANCRNTIVTLLMNTKIDTDIRNNSQELASDLIKRSGLLFPLFEMVHRSLTVETGIIE